MKPMEEAIKNLAKNADAVIKLLPDAIKEAEKTLSKEDLQKIKQVIKEVDLQGQLKKYDKAKAEFTNIFKNL